MKPDDLKIGWWYKHKNLSGALVQYYGTETWDMTVVLPATLDDLAIELGGVKCWFVDKGDEIAIMTYYTVQRRSYTVASSVDSDFHAIFIALAAAANAPVIPEEQWKELTDER
jgi:hypothetical protein